MRPSLGSLPTVADHVIDLDDGNELTAVNSSTCSVKFVDNYGCSDSELISANQYNRLTSTSSSSDCNGDDNSDSMNSYRSCDVRYTPRNHMSTRDRGEMITLYRDTVPCAVMSESRPASSSHAEK